MGRSKRRKGQFLKGYDARRSNYRPTKEECRRGFKAAIAKAELEGWNELAWLLRKVRGYYRSRS